MIRTKVIIFSVLALVTLLSVSEGWSEMLAPPQCEDRPAYPPFLEGSTVVPFTTYDSPISADNLVIRSDSILTLIGSGVWAGTLDIEVFDTIAVALDLNGFQIFNLAQLDSPVVIKEIPLQYGDWSNLMSHAGDYLYVGRSDRLMIFDVSDPVNPLKLSETVLTGTVHEIKVVGDRVYAGILRYGGETQDEPAFVILNVSNPESPVIVSKFTPGTAQKDMRTFEIVDTLVYGCSQWDNCLLVLNIADEENPVLVDSVYVTYPMDAVSYGNYLYVSQYDYNILIFDLSEQGTLKALDSIDSKRCNEMIVEGDKLYTDAEGIKTYDLSDPTQPNLLGTYTNRLWAWTFSLVDTLLYLPEEPFGFQIVSVSDATNPYLLSEFDHDVFDMYGLHVQGDYAYVANYVSFTDYSRNGLHIVDVSDKTAPVHVGESVIWYGNPTDVFVDDTLAFVAGCPPTNIYSVADPLNPYFVTSYPSQTDWTYANFVVDDYLFTMSCHPVIDIAHLFFPFDPFGISEISVDGVCTRGRPVVAGNLLYLATFNTEYNPDEGFLWTIQTQGFDSISIIDSLSIGMCMPFQQIFSYQLAMRGDYLYWAGGCMGLAVIDISNREKPDLVRLMQPLNTKYWDVVVKRGYLFLATSSLILVYSLEDPSYPELVQTIPLAASPKRLFFQDETLFVEGRWGLYTYEATLPPPDCGDADGSENVDIDDVVYLIQYIFAGGPPPDPVVSGDADCSGNVDIDDVVSLINYIFSGGNAPCDTDGDGLPDC